MNAVNTREAGRRTRKLSGAGQTLVIQRILCGDSNPQIRARLKAARLLDAVDSLTDRALYYYRSQPQCRADCESLSRAARESAHAELSEAVVHLIAQARLARQRLVDHGSNLSVEEITSLARVQFKTLRLVYHCLGLAGAVALCDADQQPAATATVEDALRKWRRSERDGRKAMVQIGL